MRNMCVMCVMCVMRESIQTRADRELGVIRDGRENTGDRSIESPRATRVRRGRGAGLIAALPRPLRIDRFSIGSYGGATSPRNLSCEPDSMPCAGRLALQGDAESRPGSDTPTAGNYTRADLGGSHCDPECGFSRHVDALVGKVVGGNDRFLTILRAVRTRRSRNRPWVPLL